MSKIQELRGEIASMEKALKNPQLPESAKGNLEKAIKNAKGQLSDLEAADSKPMPSPTPKANALEDTKERMTKEKNADKKKILAKKVSELENKERIKAEMGQPVEYPLRDAEGNRRIDNAALDALEKHLETLPQTKAMHTNNGTYTPQRKAFHHKIITEMEQGNTCIKRGKPIAIFTGGAPGSGKSTFIKKNYNWLINPSIFHIDADEVRAQLPEYKGWNAAITHEETQDIVNELIDYIAPKDCRFDVVIDGTFTNLKKYRQMIKKVQDLGYETFGIFMHIDPKISMQRAMERFQRAGRFVPRFVIEDVNSKGDAVFQELKSEIDGWVEVDGISSKVIGRGGKDLPSNRDYGTLSMQPGDDTIPTKAELKKEADVIPVKELRDFKRVHIGCEMFASQNDGDDAEVIKFVGGEMIAYPNDWVLYLGDGHPFTVIQSRNFEKRCIVLKDGEKSQLTVKATNGTVKKVKNTEGGVIEKVKRKKRSPMTSRVENGIKDLASKMKAKDCSIAQFIKDTDGTPIDDSVWGRIAKWNAKTTQEKITKVGIEKSEDNPRFIAETVDYSEVFRTIRYYSVCADKGEWSLITDAEKPKIAKKFENKEFRMQYSRAEMNRMYNYGDPTQKSYDTHLMECKTLAADAYKTRIEKGSAEAKPKYQKHYNTCRNQVMNEYNRAFLIELNDLARKHKEDNKALTFREAFKAVRQKLREQTA
jgi:predicted ABC-type ATPase